MADKLPYVTAYGARMSQHYEIFYSLEKSIRSLVADTLQAAEGEGWWSTKRVPLTISKEAEARMQREIDSGTTPRSSDPLDFTTFGELGELMKSNWDVFGAIFTKSESCRKSNEQFEYT